MEPKAKMRTSEDVYNRLRWDEDLAAGEEAVLGYEDRLVGPMEVRFAAFVPVAEGGDLPFHRIFYVRRGGRVLWDRRRRLDRVFGSGATPQILAHEQGAKVRGFSAVEDQQAAEATRQAMARAQENLAAAEERRQWVLDQRQRERLRRKQAGRPAAKAGGGTAAADAEEVRIVAGRSSQAPSRMSLRVATWNALCDEYEVDPELPQAARAPLIAAALREADPDVVALQECEAALLLALEAGGFGDFWRTDGPGELLVLSRYPMARAVSVVLGPHKRALLVELAVQRRAVAVANVHLTGDRRGDESVDNSEKRGRQALEVRAALAKHMPHADAFVCGDFNEPGTTGAEVVAEHLVGLVDAWPAVHGEEPGFTFDPSRNRLAEVNSVIKVPRRLDRVFAPPRWVPQAVSLLGQSPVASDHFGLLAAFALQSARLAVPVHTSSLALLPPEGSWPQINEIRRRFDPSFPRWMPHVNLVYGFVPEADFEEAAAAIEAVARSHDVFELRFAQMEILEHGRSAALVIQPECSPPDGLLALQRDLEELFLNCKEQSSRGRFLPHLTLGKFESSAEARRWAAELQQSWRPVTFTAQELALLARAGPEPFHVRGRVPLGPVLGGQDAARLEMLEARSGTRAFALGSAALLGAGRPQESDFDVLLVGPQPREAVFRALEASMQASWSRRAEGQFPVLQLEVDGVHLDVQYARSTSLHHPTLWPSAACEEGGLAAAALRDLHALRALVLAAGGLASWRRFQAALLQVKAWARLRGINSNALGYLGGWSWSLLLAATLLAGDAPDEAEDDGLSLAMAMWRRFADWPWPQPVVFKAADAGEGALAAHGGTLMPILCPSDPSTNSARNVTGATLAVLRSELQLAAAGGIHEPALDNFLASYGLFVRCEASAEKEAQPLCAAWLEARLLVLIRDLDHLMVRPLWLAPGLWALGLTGEAAVAHEAAGRFRALVDRGEWGGQISVEVEGREALELALQRAQAGAAPGTPPPPPPPAALQPAASPSEAAPPCGAGPNGDRVSS